MSLDILSKSHSDNRAENVIATRRRRSFAWALPFGLMVGFLAILALLFGEKLRPALAVKTAPVITIRAATSAPPGGEEESRLESGRRVETGARGDLLFQASGWVEPDPYITFVPTLTNGVVDEVHVLEGQKVEKGELLATLIDEDAKLDLREAERKYASLEKKITAHCNGFDIIEAQIEAARRKTDAVKTRLREARDTLNRLEQLSAGAVSRQQLVQARLAVEREAAMLAEAEAEIPRLRAQLTQLGSEKESMLAGLDELETARDRAQLALERTRITSPMDGRVLHLHAAPGKKRMLNMESEKSAVIVELYDPQKLQARIDVPLNEAAGLFVGQPVELLSEILPETTFSGRVTRITGQADLQRNTLQAKVQIDKPDDRLRPDMLVRAKFFSVASKGKVVGEGAGSGDRLALYLPAEALRDGGTVWVVTPGATAERRQVRVGDEVRDGHRLVKEGLRSGETVILSPPDQLEEGMRVEANPTNPSK